MQRVADCKAVIVRVKLVLSRCVYTDVTGISLVHCVYWLFTLENFKQFVSW